MAEASSLSISARNGAEDCAPQPVAEMEAAAFVSLRAASAELTLPSAMAAASAPLKTSPAAVVSMALTLSAWNQWQPSFAGHARLRPPRV